VCSPSERHAGGTPRAQLRGDFVCHCEPCEAGRGNLPIPRMGPAEDFIRGQGERLASLAMRWRMNPRALSEDRALDLGGRVVI